jgi:hypothetical protein
MRAIATTPPTTPPAMGPALDFLLEVVEEEGKELGREVAPGVAVAGGELPVDSGAPGATRGVGLSLNVGIGEETHRNWRH